MPLRPACLRRNGKSQATAAAAPRRGGSRARGAKGAPARNNNSFHFFNVNSNLKFEVLLKWPSLSLSILRRMAQFSKRPRPIASLEREGGASQSLDRFLRWITNPVKRPPLPSFEYCNRPVTVARIPFDRTFHGFQLSKSHRCVSEILEKKMTKMPY